MNFIKWVEFKINKNIKMLLIKFKKKLELHSKHLERLAFKTRPKIEEHLLIVMDKSSHDGQLSQPLQTNNKQFKITVSFLTGYNGIFNVTKKNNIFYFKKSITDPADFIQITSTEGSYEIGNLNNEIRRFIVGKSYYTEEEYPFKIKPNFTTLGSIS